MLLENKIVLLTGAASGIGAAAAALFARQGAKLALVDVNAAALKEVAASLDPDKVVTIAGSVADESVNQEAVARCVERFGGVDVALLNVGVTGQLGPIASISAQSFDETMAINVRGAFLGVKHTLPKIAQRGGGSIVITASTAGFRAGAPGRYAYVVSKHAVVGLMRAAAAEAAPLKVRVNSISPGGVDTPMSRSLKDIIGEERAKEAMAAFTKSIPLGRIAEPDDIAQAMLFFASDMSRYCTATNLMVDGGLMG